MRTLSICNLKSIIFKQNKDLCCKNQILSENYNFYPYTLIDL
ncbi:MAG: hypothetical protein WCQ54_04515 [Clostridiaceae bacterium]